MLLSTGSLGFMREGMELSYKVAFDRNLLVIIPRGSAW